MPTTKTMKQWNASGRRVVKGSKCVGKNQLGEALFTEDQTAPSYQRSSQCHDSDDGFYDDFGDGFGHWDFM